jgi:hypothetical protein
MLAFGRAWMGGLVLTALRTRLGFQRQSLAHESAQARAD